MTAPAPVEEPAILPPPNVRPKAATPKPAAPHRFADLVPGRVVHYVMKSGECRGAFVVYVYRVKGRMVQVGEDPDETGGPSTPIMRQEYTLPDRGTCALQVEALPVFDQNDVYPDMAQNGRWFRETVTHAPGAKYEEDAEPGTWHHIDQHD